MAEGGSLERRSPGARARFAPSIPSVDGHDHGARISSDAALCLCRSACTTALLPAPTATLLLPTGRHRVGRHRPDRGQCLVQGPAVSLDSHAVDQPTPKTLVVHLAVIDDLPHLTSRPGGASPTRRRTCDLSQRLQLGGYRRLATGRRELEWPQTGQGSYLPFSAFWSHGVQSFSGRLSRVN